MAVEKIYTKQQIDAINMQKKAVNGQIYTDENGNKFIGTHVGTIRLIQYSSAVIHNETTVEVTLDQYGEAIDSLTDTMVTEEELSESDASLRGFSIAMSLSL